MAFPDNRITITVNGKEYDEFEAGRTSRSLDSLGGSYEFIVNSDMANSFPIHSMDTAIVKVNGTPVLTGYVEKINSVQSPEDHNVSIAGHDKTVDIVDCSIEQNSSYNCPISLKELIERVIQDNMITPYLTNSFRQIATVQDVKAEEVKKNSIDFYENMRPLSSIVPAPLQRIGDIDTAVWNIQVIDRTESETRWTTDNQLVTYPAAFVYDIIAGDPGEKIFDYIDRHAKKKACILTTDGYGNIIIYRNAGIDLGIKLVNKKDGENGVIKSSSFDVDMSRRFRRLIVRSQMPGGGDIQGIAFDEQVQMNRTKIITADDICDEEMAALMALWEVNKRRADSIVYKCDVYGYWATKDTIWQPNQIIDIQDDVQGVHCKMLLRDVSYSTDKNEGSVTTLGFVMPDSYALQANDPRVKYNNPMLVRYL